MKPMNITFKLPIKVDRVIFPISMATVELLHRELSAAMAKGEPFQLEMEVVAVPGGFEDTGKTVVITASGVADG
jgi:hypothetical protein